MDPELIAKARSGLVVLPNLSDEQQALNPAIQAILGPNKTAKMLANNNFKGVCIRLPQQSVVKNDSQGNQVLEKISLGCLYVPAPNFDRIVVIKNVNDLSRSISVPNITESVNHQLIYLNGVISQIKANFRPSSDKTLLQCFINSPAKVIKSKNYNDLQSSIQSVVADNDSHLKHLQIELEFTKEKKIASVLQGRLESLISGDCFEITRYLVHLHRNACYQLKSEEVKFLNSEPSNFYDIDKVIEMFKFFFPDRLEKFYTVPELNQLEENMLYCTTEEGELGKLADYGAYMGEIKLFSEQLLSQHQKELTGVFLKSFSNKHLESIVDSNFLKPENFEFDWVYLGSDKIVVFEVGLSETPSEPWRMIQNKITQSLTKHIPQMQLIMHSIQMAIGETHNSHSDLLRSNLTKKWKLCIHFPQLNEQMFRLEFETIKNRVATIGNPLSTQLGNYAEQFLRLLIEQKSELINNLLFLISENSTNSLKLLEVDLSFELTDSSMSLQNLLGVATNRSQNKSFDYACSLLTIASLNYLKLRDGDKKSRTPMDVDKRYRHSFLKWVKNRDKYTAEGIILSDTFKFILSPQQHRILREKDISHLIITGQPGSGKTTLLLAKCEQICSSPDVQKILFLYDGEKILFRNYLDKLVGTNCSEAMRRKLTVLDIQSASLKEMGFDGSTKIEKTVVMIDEVSNFEIPFLDALRYCKCCWISLTETGSDKKTDNLYQLGFPDVFHHENLNVLFRSSSHISSVSSSYIDRRLQQFPFPVKPVRVPGCFKANQLSIRYQIFNGVYTYKKNELFSLSEHETFLESTLTDRLIIILSEDIVPRSELEEIGLSWGATQIVNDTQSEKVQEVSGSEFQSVLVMADASVATLEAINMAVTRAQYEVGIVVFKDIREWDKEKEFTTYLEALQSEYVRIYDQFTADPPCNIGWLSLSDDDTYRTDWWERKLERLLKGKAEDVIELFSCQTVSVRLQISLAFPRLFCTPTRTHASQKWKRSTNGKWTIVTLEEVHSLDDTTLAGSNSLYWSVMSNDKNVISDWIEYLSKRGLLSNEVNKTYPNATIFHLLLRRFKYPYELLVHLLQKNVVRGSTLFVAFKKHHVLHLMMEHESGRISSLPSTSGVLCGIFVKGAFDSKEDRENQIEMYRLWRSTHVHLNEKQFTDKVLSKIRGLIIRHSHLLLDEVESFVESSLTEGVSFRKCSPMLLSENEVPEAFFQNCLGIDSGECEDEQILKYQKEWRGFHLSDLVTNGGDLITRTYLNVLKRRPFILNYEVNVMLQKIESRSDRKRMFSWGLGRLRLVLIENDEVCDVIFNECLGFESGESEERRIEKYKKWGGRKLLASVAIVDCKALTEISRVWKRYNFILKYEVSQIIQSNNVFQRPENFPCVASVELSIAQQLFKDEDACDVIFRCFVGFGYDDSTEKKIEKYEQRAEYPLIVCMLEKSEEMQNLNNKVLLLEKTLEIAKKAWTKYGILEYGLNRKVCGKTPEQHAFDAAYERDSTQTIDAQSGEDLSDEGFLDLQSVLREPISSHSLDEEFCQAESLSPEPLVEPESLYSGPEFDIEDDIP
ncbi:uncharacterized protein LOC142348340 isoform X2 [Convolutriloba macropyga]|uniref:uncharacterized protein LOC142348340 isoform X2 n=1 Tax=Convolutriloba macropyga TaxID=536237 RepID=UPI003F526595